MNREDLNIILEKHANWLKGEEGGERADLSGVNLSGAYPIKANLSGANLSGANLIRADLSEADLSEADLSRTNLYIANLSGANLFRADLSEANLFRADLSGANLSGADLSGTNLFGADLSGTNLFGANLYGADLSGANLFRADLSGANLSGADLSNIRIDDLARTRLFPMACPEKGSFIGWKAADSYIVELLIPEDAKRSSAYSRKCRCDKAKVLSITNIDGSDAKRKWVRSHYDPDFIYTIGETVTVGDFDECRWNECSTGIHFFITRQETVDYEF